MPAFNKFESGLIIFIMNKTFSITTLGCKLNFSESSEIARLLMGKGYKKVDSKENSDLILINTCTVTELANKKSKQAIRKMVNRNPKAKLIAVGCYSQLKPEEVSGIEGVDLVLGANNKFDVTKMLNLLENDKPIDLNTITEDNTFNPSYSIGDRTRSFFKIQDGCDYHCSYCTIPFARGRSRNNNIESTVAKAKEVVNKGIKELILTGVNIGDFGKTTGESFLELLQELVKVEGLKRLRISSVEPNLLSDEIIEFASKSNVIVPHFHIPLQCGTDNLLRLMRRRYTTSLFASRVAKIKELMPMACIAADVIVGVPGESEQEFASACEFIKSIDVSNLHVFTYSERENTMAVKMENQVPITVRKGRSKFMHQIANEKQNKFQEQNLNSIQNVLFVGDFNDSSMYGFTENYIRVAVPLKPELINEIAKVKLLHITKDGNVKAELI